jgi:hypothetical protein
MTIYSPTPSASNEDAVESGVGSKDGRGCSDNDQAYVFGRRPTSVATFPFTSRQYAHLLSLRGRIADGLTGADDLEVTPKQSQTSSDGQPVTRTSLFYSCLSCGGMVPGGHQSEPRVLCPQCSLAGDRDGVARLILSTAGVI